MPLGRQGKGNHNICGITRGCGSEALVFWPFSRLKFAYESVEKAQMAVFCYSCAVKNRTLGSQKGRGNCMF